MTFHELALNNLRRSPVRSLLTALSVAVSAATLCVVLSLDRGYTSAVKSDLVDKTGVHLYVTKEGCPIEAASVIAQGGLSPLYLEESVLDVVRSLPQLDAVMPFKLFSVTTSDGSRTDIFMGVTEAIGRVRPDWTLEKGAWFSSDNSIILGSEIARQEQLAVGDTTYSEHFDRTFVVSGILKRSYTQDDGCFFLPLATAQKLIGREGKLSAIAVKLKDITQLSDIQTRLRGMLPKDHFVIGSKELSDGILQFFGSTRVIMFVMVFVAFGVSVFGIINTMLMSVMERKKELAYLKCIGAASRDLVLLISFETLTICLIGSVLGAVAGVAASPLFGNFVRQFIITYVPSGPMARPDVSIVAASLVMCVAVGIACAVYPAWRAARIVPMEVLRNE